MHRFLWERWYIDRFYNWFFVQGALRIAAFVAGVCEAALDILLHRKVPRAIGTGGNALIDLIRADATDLTNNIAYILAMAVLFIAAVLWWI